MNGCQQCKAGTLYKTPLESGAAAAAVLWVLRAWALLDCTMSSRRKYDLSF